eukprot:scaffold148569_cov17-Tisochrysis_lutea.AAC.2
MLQAWRASSNSTLALQDPYPYVSSTLTCALQAWRASSILFFFKSPQLHTTIRAESCILHYAATVYVSSALNPLIYEKW